MVMDRPKVRRSLVVSGPGRPDEVWDRYVRPERWAEWSPQIRSVAYGAETLSPHTTGVVRGPAGLRVSFEVLAVDGTDPVRS